MEASHQDEQAQESEAEKATVGVSGEDIAEQNAVADPQQPIGEAAEGHGTVHTRSGAPVSTASGDPLDDATKAGLSGEGTVPAAGESTPPQGAAGAGEGGV